MKKKRESGEVVVEASLVVSIALIFITVMLFIGIVLYHQTMLTSVANKTATSIAQLYSNSIKDPFTGYIDSESLYQEVNYSDFKTDEYVQQIEAKANALAKYRLKSASMLEAEIVDVDVDVVKKPREVLKSQVVVTIKGRYNVPLVGFFGVSDGKTSFTVTGRADCMDLLEYVNGVEAIGNPEAENIVPVMGEETCVVTFIISKEDGGFHAAVPVLKGKSIITSNHYSHSTMPRNPVLGELEFTGWVTDSGAGFNAGTTVQSDITVYGTWLCTVTFDPTGGSVLPDQMDVSYKKTANFPIPTRTGYAFEGWFTQPEGKGTQYVSNSTPITENITLYAHWRCTHDFNVTQVRKGTCVQKYRYKYTCVRCPYSYEQDGAYGICEKDSGTVEIQPSCTNDGKRVYKCKFCKAIKSQQKLNKLGHDFQSSYRAPTCAQNGFEGKKCRRCGYEEGRTIGRTAHNFSGRCGKTHTITAQKLQFHNTSSGYIETYEGECIICVNCGAPRNEKWIYENGDRHSDGVYCRRHKDNNGSWVYCGGFKERTVISVH